MSLLKREDGQDQSEYALLLALIAVVVTAGLRLLGCNITSILYSLAAAL